MADNDIVTFVNDVVVDDGMLRLLIPRKVLSVRLALSQSVHLLLFALHDVVADLEDGSLVLQVLEDLRIHLQIHLENFTEHGVEAVVEHSCDVFAVGAALLLPHRLKLLDQLLVLFKHGAAHDEVQAVFQDVVEYSPSVEVLIVASVVHHSGLRQFPRHHFHHFIILSFLELHPHG